jgi:hypothetical protein
MMMMIAAGWWRPPARARGKEGRAGRGETARFRIQVYPLDLTHPKIMLPRSSCS